MPNDLSKYEAVKCQMQTGDLLLWETETLIGKTIQLFTKSHFSHASLVLRMSEYEGENQRRFTTEAVRDGVGINLLSRRLEYEKGFVWWYPLKDVSQERRNEIGRIALDYLGRPYDFKGVIRWVFKEVSVDGEALFCSELCYMAYGYTGDAPAPDDLLKLPIFGDGVQIL